MILKVRNLITCFIMLGTVMNTMGVTIQYFEDIQVEFVNYTYFDKDTFDLSINYNPDSKNTLKVRIDLIEDLPEKPFVKISVKTRAFGQEIPTGIVVNGDICNGGKMQNFYDNLIKPFGVEDCPPAKGTYEKEEFAPEFSTIPVKLISGTHLLVDILVYAEEIQIIKFKAFITL